MFSSQQVKILPFGSHVVSQQKVVLEDRILTDRFRSTAPANEFEFGDTEIRFEIETASRVACPK
ncbi:hypothetical protein D3C86_2167440 [compost metagenome]